VRIEDPSERYYDTLMPSMISVAESLGLTIHTTYNGSSFPVIDLKAIDYKQVLPFPYDGGRGATRKIEDNVGSLLNNIDNSSALTSPSFSYKPLRRIYFSKYRFLNPAQGTGVTGRQSSTNVTGALGFNYGIYNIDPQNSSMVFRYDRYGQFRDILEQRNDSKFYKPQTAIVKGKTRPSNTVTDSPVMIRFVSSSSEIEVSPYQTDSVNKSIESTSSLPYFDPYFG